MDYEAKLKCYSYTRVSTTNQVEGYSLDAQRERIRAYASYRDMEIVAEYSDEGRSGKNIASRPEFQRMLDDIMDKREVSYVLVFKLSRFGRNAADVLSSLQKMQDYGVNLICVEDGIDSSKDAGKLMISVLSAVAEIERENILVQTMEGRRQKAREGRWNGGQAPYGYRLEKGELIIDENEAPAIRALFDEYVRTPYGMGAVAKYLNTHFTKVNRQNNKLHEFSKDFVTKVFDNPVYYGKIAYGRRANVKENNGGRNTYHRQRQETYLLYDGKHEPIVSEELWMKAHAKRMETGIKTEKTYSLEHEHVLSAIARCPVCGGPLYGAVSRKWRKGEDGEKGERYKDHFYYQCRHPIDAKTGERCKNRRTWRQEVIDGAVADIIKQLVNTPRFHDAMKAKLNEQTDVSELEETLKDRQRQIRSLEAAKNRIIDQLDHFDDAKKGSARRYDDLNSRLDELYAEIDEAELQAAETRDRISNIQQEKITADKVVALLENFDKIYDAMTDAEKKELMSLLLERVEIFADDRPDGRIIKSMELKFPIFTTETAEHFGLENEDTVETVVLMSRKDT